MNPEPLTGPSHDLDARFRGHDSENCHRESQGVTPAKAGVQSAAADRRR